MKRGLFSALDEWKWSSFQSYAFGDEGPVRINCQEWPLKLTCSQEKAQSFPTPPRAPASEKRPLIIEKQSSPSSTDSSETRG